MDNTYKVRLKKNMLATTANKYIVFTEVLLEELICIRYDKEVAF